MENKYSLEIQKEIDDILNNIDAWKDLFFINYEFYYDGWAIFLKEKNIYPRKIVIFKSYSKNSYSIKSFEIHFNNNIKKEKFKELYSKKNIENKKKLLNELKEIIYGKDLLFLASKIYYNQILE